LQRETQLLVSLAQGIGAIFGGLLASQLHDATRSWVSVFFLLWQSRPI
jgi:cyanate permease